MFFVYELVKYFNLFILFFFINNKEYNKLQYLRDIQTYYTSYLE